VGRIEETLLTAAQKLSPEQACLSYGRLKNMLNMISKTSSPPNIDWKPVCCSLFAVSSNLSKI
jgi:hypothetical protein